MLLDHAVLDGDFAIEQSRQAIGKGTVDLRFDLLRVDGMARIGGRYNPVHFDLLVDDGYFGTGGNIAAIAHMLRQPPENAFRGGFVPTGFVGHRIQHSQMLGTVAQHFLAESQRILSGRHRQFVNETFEIKRVLVVIDPAPIPRWQRRIAHRVVDQQIGDGITEHALGTIGVQALEGRGITPVLQARGIDARQDRLAGNTHMHGRHIALCIQPCGQFALGDRVVMTVQHVLLARPDQLDRHIRHLFGNQHRLAHIVVADSTTAKTTAEQQTRDIALADRQAGCFHHRLQSRLAVLARGPDIAARTGEQRRRIHRFHRGMVLVRIAIGRLHRLGSLGKPSFHVPGLIADKSLFGGQPLFQGGSNIGTGQLGMRSLVPDNRHLLEGRFGLPPRVGNHRHALAIDRDHFFDAGLVGNGRRIETFQGAAENRAIGDGGMQHAGHGEIHAIDLRPVHLGHRIETRQRLSGDCPGFGVFQHDVLGRFHRGGQFGHLTIRGAAVAGLVGDDAFVHDTIGRRHIPGLGCGGHQHHARTGSALADIEMGITDAATAAGGIIAPDPAACRILPRCGLFGGDFGPVAFQLFGHQLRQSGQGALPHFLPCDANDHAVIRFDHHPGIDLGGWCGGFGLRDMETE